MTLTIATVEVRRDDLRSARVHTEALPRVAAGRALLRIDLFSLTSNNVTYGVTGDQLRYWDFFPAGDGWGRIPAWGFADVVESQVEGLAAGTRVYGFLPMATHLLVEPKRVGSHGFTDAAAHRAALPGAYNRYQRTDTDPLYSPATEGLQAVLLPLFVTSFMLEDYLADADDFGAEQFVVTSASSKTALGTALCLGRRQQHRRPVIGLTSARHVDYVAGLGCYDQVLAYPDVGDVDPGRATVLLDMAGDRSLRWTIHDHFGAALQSSVAIGLARWDAPRATQPLPGPAPEFFFAPAQIEKKVAEWGPAEYQRRLAHAWSDLLAAADQWFTLQDVAGLDAVPETLRALIDGSADPSAAFVARIAD